MNEKKTHIGQIVGDYGSALQLETSEQKVTRNGIIEKPLHFNPPQH